MTYELRLNSSKLYLIDAIFGRGGLEQVRAAVAAQQRWRSSCSASSSVRLAMSSVSKTSRLPSPMKVHLRSQRAATEPSSSISFPPISSPRRMELVQFLQSRDLKSTTFTGITDMRSASPLSPRELLVASPPAPSSPPRQLPIGSFPSSLSLNQSNIDQWDCQMDPGHTTPASMTSGEAQARKSREVRLQNTELRKVEAALLAAPPVDVALYKQWESDRNKRVRHGRPPSKQTNSRKDFSVAFRPVAPNVSLQDNHERKKNALVRRFRNTKPT